MLSYVGVASFAVACSLAAAVVMGGGLDAAATDSPAAAVVVTLPAAGSQDPALPRWWRRLGSGHAMLTTRSDWQAALAAARSGMDLQAVRFHGMLDDDMSTLLGVDRNGSLHTSFRNIDTSYDGMLAQGVKPYVELSFMPELLAKNASQTVFHYKGGTSPPADYSQFAQLITDTVQHLLDRYGAEEVHTWQFEVWNEPNCGFWSGTQAEYFTLYNWTSLAIKAVDPNIRVGGPSTCQLGWIPEFLAYVKQNSLPLDFVSSHLYPTDPSVAKIRTGFVDNVTNASKIAADAGYPFVLSEYNSGLDKQISDLDGPYSSAFVVHVISRLKDSWAKLATTGNDPLGAGLSYWSISDVFEEGGFQPEEFHHGYGIQSVSGVAKPVFRAFELINNLQGPLASITVSGEGSVNVDALGSVRTASVVSVGAERSAAVRTAAVVASNWAPGFMPPGPVNVTFQFENACCASTCPKAAQLTTIDDTSANARTAWEAMGSPLYPTPEQVASMMSASAAKAVSVDLAVVGTSQVSTTVELSPFATAYVEFDLPC